MKQYFLCSKCSGTGIIPISKEDGGPACTKCGGHGYLTQRLLMRSIAAILDGPSVYMGGPSHGAQKKAENILSFMEKEWGVGFPHE